MLLNDPVLQAAWVAALRSGEYKQGTHHLRSTDNSYCCLGVLCELGGLEWTIDPHSDGRRYDTYVENDGEMCGAAAFPPSGFLEKLGVDADRYSDRYSEKKSFLWDLAKDNDSGVPFAKIADKIEAFE